MRLRDADLLGAGTFAIGVNVASATSTDQAPIRNFQSLLASLTPFRSCHPLLFA